MTRERSASRLKQIVQLIGFLIGLALLGWCVHTALAPENRAQLEKLSAASPTSVLGLFVLTAASLALNGLAFFAAIRPVKKLPATDLIAVNALATFLNYLPFKLSIVSRVVIHHRRDGLPLLTIGAWLAAVAVTMLAVLGPLVLASLYHQDITLGWCVLVTLGIAVDLAIICFAARVFKGQAGLVRLHAIVARVGISPLNRLVRSSPFARLHQGFDMLADPRMLALAATVRLADILVQAARFMLAAAILGQSLPAEAAIILASTFFLIGVVSPTGMLGIREAGTTGIAGLVLSALTAASGAADASQAAAAFAAVVLLVSGVDAVVNLAAAALSIAWLRPDKLLRTARAS